MTRPAVTLRQKAQRKMSAQERVDALNDKAAKLAKRDYPGALALAAQAELLAERSGHPRGGVASLLLQSTCHSELARNAEAIACAQRALNLSRDLHDSALTVECLHKIGLQFNLAGDYPHSLHCFERMLAQCNESGDFTGAGTAHCLIGLTRQYLGESRAAETSYAEALAIARRHSLKALEARACMNLGEHFFVTEDHKAAIAQMRRSLKLFTALGDANWAATVQANLGPAYVAAGDLPAAREALLASLRHFRACKGVRMQGIALINLSEVDTLAGRPAAAARLAERALKLARRNGDKRQQIYALEALGRAEHARGEAATARRHLTAAGKLALAAQDREALQAVRRTLARLSQGKGE